MKLISVNAGSKTASDMLDLMITADLEDGGAPSSLPFGWRRGDPYGLGPQIDDWMDAHPEFVPAAYVAPPVPLPDLAPYQFRAMLSLSGHQTALDNYIAGLPDPQKTIAQAKLDYSTSFQRQNELVLAAQQALGLSDSDLDALWRQAAAIT